MQRRRQFWLAWALFGFVVLSSVASVLVEVASRREALTLDAFGTLWFDIVILPALAGIGALIVARRPDNRIGLLLLIPVLVLSIITWIQPYLYRFTAEPPAATPLLLFLSGSPAGAGSG